MNIISKIKSKIGYMCLSTVNNWANLNWFNDPISGKPRGSESEFIRLGAEAASKRHGEIEDLEKKTGFSIDKSWLDELALETQIVIKKSELNYAHGRILYSELRRYLSSAANGIEKVTILETGTARGFSSLCMAKALDDHDRSGTIITFDVLPHRNKMYWNCIADHTRGKLTREELLSSWKPLVDKYIVFHQGYSRIELPKVVAQRIHFAFLDGAHTYDDVMFEFLEVKDSQHVGDVIVFDDYNHQDFPGLVKAVDEICDSYGYEKNVIKSDGARGYVVARKLK